MYKLISAPSEFCQFWLSFLVRLLLTQFALWLLISLAICFICFKVESLINLTSCFVTICSVSRIEYRGVPLLIEQHVQ